MEEIFPTLFSKMEGIFPTLFSKTFFILTIQLLLTWLSAHITLTKFQQLHAAQNTPWIKSTYNQSGQIDLHIDWQHIEGFTSRVTTTNIYAFFVLLFWGQFQPIGIALLIFGAWSMLTGITIAFALLSVDENLGSKILAITATITFTAFIIGVYSKTDFESLDTFLFIALIGLTQLNLMRLFKDIPGPAERRIAGISVVIFTLYLVCDFNRLARLQDADVNNWHAAIDISIDLYLDIINLFIDLLDAISGLSNTSQT